MKKIAAVFLALTGVVCTALPAYSQKTAVAPSSALLYEVTGKGLAKPSFLFGTIHVICPADMLPLEKVTSYLDKTDQLIMELDMDDPNEMKAMTSDITFRNGKTLVDYLTPAEYEKVDQMFQGLLGYSVDRLKMVKPSFLSVIAATSPKSIGCSSPSSYDLSLVKIAAEKKMPLLGLETAQFQHQMMDKRPVEKQAKSLYEMAADPQKAANDLKQVIEAYKAQDTDKLHLVSESKMSKDKEFQAYAIDDRNRDWIPKLEEIFRTKASFVAVGAGHFGGDKGVIKLLRSKGYQVRPIRL